MANGFQEPRVEMEREDSTLYLFLIGDWVLDNSHPDFQSLVDEVREQGEGAEQLCLCGKGIEQWDTSVLPFLQASESFASGEHLTLDLGRMPEGIRELFDLVRAAPEKGDERRHEKQRNPLYAVGEWTLQTRKDIDSWFDFIGSVAAAFFRLCTGRAQWRGRDFLLVLEEVGARAFPIVTLISFLVGLIITFLGIVVLTRFNAGYYVSYLVGYGMLREMGALMTGVILSGRTGAAFAAEIGSMKVNEELDALESVAVNPVEFLVLPRLIALILMMPLLTIYADVIGIVAGALVASEMQDIALPIFAKGLGEAVSMADFLLGLVKSLVFGIIIAVTGCLRGFQCGKDATAVGSAATSAVVTSITLIVAFNALIDWIAALYNI